MSPPTAARQVSAPRQASPRRSSLSAVTGIAVALLTLAVLTIASHSLPMTWDEGNGMLRAGRAQEWMTRVLLGVDDPSLSAFRPEILRELWPFTNQVEGHPALYAWLIALGHSLGQLALAPLQSARLGPIGYFAFAMGVTAWRIAQQQGARTAWACAVMILLLPRLFAHVQIASFDGPLTSSWLLCWAAFASARERLLGACILGLCFGLVFSSKATGWFAPFGFAAWVILFRDRRGLQALTVAIPVGLVVFWILNPSIWYEPIEGFRTFLRLNGNREFNIPTYFLGQRYDLDHPLPWYNTLFWLFAALPLTSVLLALWGAHATLRDPAHRRFTTLIVLNAVVLLIVRALPFAPPHDGFRLMLPALPFWGILAGLGLAQLLHFESPQSSCDQPATHNWPPRLLRRLAPCLAALALANSLFNLYWYQPQWLSYYSVCVGGLRGATQRGLEPTYYWDAFDTSVTQWLNQHTDPDKRVALPHFPQENLGYYRQWGILTAAAFEHDPRPPQWYVLQHRPSMWNAADRWLVGNRQPVFRKVIREGGWGVWQVDVPLVLIYSYEDFEHARAVTNKPDEPLE